MSWNIFKRVAELEQWVKDLRDFNSDHSRWIKQLEDEMRKVSEATFIHSVQLNSKYSEVPPMPSLVDEEKEKKRQYQREWYAKKQAKLKREKNVQAAREKKNAYHRAYYARKKGATNA
jgi:membrane-bound lytic murein transglycosylase B